MLIADGPSGIMSEVKGGKVAMKPDWFIEYEEALLLLYVRRKSA